MSAPQSTQRKRRRLNLSTGGQSNIQATTTPNVPVNVTTHLVDPEPDSATPPRTPTTLSVATLPRAGSTVDATACSLTYIEDQSHLDRVALQNKMAKGKGTDASYTRHLKHYLVFWSGFQLALAKEDPTWVEVPAQPITAAKVAHFLKHESTRTKHDRSGNQITGTSVGRSSIRQSITALEHYRYNHQHEQIYRNCPESHHPLRDDIRITAYESAARANEPQRVAEAQILKANGTTADSYTREELIKASIWCLDSDRATNLQIHIGIRDRAMLLISTSIAFRGDSSRMLLWSDLMTRDVPMIDIGLNAQVKALVILANQAKTNTTGRVDEHGAFRHRFPELCPIGGLGFYFFSHFHIIQSPLPSFTADFSDPAYPEYGRRDWYKLHLFPGGKSGAEPMHYQNHRERINIIHARNGISISKATHGGRPFAAITAREHGATAYDTKALGNWSTNDIFGACYDRSLPKEAMLAAAMFNGQKPETYVLPRGFLEPPKELLTAIFPWIEQERLTYSAQLAAHGRSGTDNSLKHFLNLLEWLRKVILQDTAVLYQQYPTCAFFSFPPFNTDAFRLFSASSTIILAEAERQSQQQISALPEVLASSMGGILSNLNLEQQRGCDQAHIDRKNLEMRFDMVTALLQGVLGSKSRSWSSSSDLSSPMNQSSPATPAISGNHMSPLVHSESCPFPIDSPHAPSASATHSEAIPELPMMPPPLPTPHPTPHPIGIQQNLVNLSTNPLLRQQQLDSFHNLEVVFPVDRLHKHIFEWIKYPNKNSRQDEWLPIYHYPSESGLTIRDIWEEWSVGLNGFLSVVDLNRGWDARWRRNTSANKSLATRRKKIITLIEKLAGKPNWTPTLAVRFLETQYKIPNPSLPHLHTTRSFMAYLAKNPTLTDQIVENANLS